MNLTANGSSGGFLKSILGRFAGRPAKAAPADEALSTLILEDPILPAGDAAAVPGDAFHLDQANGFGDGAAPADNETLTDLFEQHFNSGETGTAVDWDTIYPDDAVPGPADAASDGDAAPDTGEAATAQPEADAETVDADEDWAPATGFAFSAEEIGEADTDEDEVSLGDGDDLFLDFVARDDAEDATPEDADPQEDEVPAAEVEAAEAADDAEPADPLAEEPEAEAALADFSSDEVARDDEDEPASEDAAAEAAAEEPEDAVTEAPVEEEAADAAPGDADDDADEAVAAADDDAEADADEAADAEAPAEDADLLAANAAGDATSDEMADELSGEDAVETVGEPAETDAPMADEAADEVAAADEAADEHAAADEAADEPAAADEALDAVPAEDEPKPAEETAPADAFDIDAFSALMDTPESPATEDQTAAPEAGEVLDITDFDPENDVIGIYYTKTVDAVTGQPVTPKLQISAFADGTGHMISVDGCELARVIGAKSLTEDQVALIYQ